MKLPLRAAIDAMRPMSRFFIERPRFAAVVSIEVRDCGITVDCASIERLGMINLWSRGGGIGRLEISDYVFETLRPELQRIHGVGGVETDGQRKAIRVWIDPFRCAAQSISSAEIVDDVPSHGELTE